MRWRSGSARLAPNASYFKSTAAEFKMRWRRELENGEGGFGLSRSDEIVVSGNKGLTHWLFSEDALAAL